MRKAIAALLLLVPGVAFGAGFAKQSLFLSKSSVTEGDTVLIHAILSNDTSGAFDGSVVLSDEDAKIGSVPVKLAAGEASAVSVSWKPSAGSHKVSAKLQATDGTVVEEESETFSIKAKPQPASAANDSASVQSSQGIQDGIAGVSPQTAATIAPFFALVDGGRAKAADTLQSQLDATKQSLGAGAGNPGSVLSAESSKNAVSNPMGSFWYILRTLYLYLLTILLFLISSAGVFYPLLALIVLYLLWRVFKRFRRA